MNRRPSQTLHNQKNHPGRYHTTSADSFTPAAYSNRRRISIYPFFVAAIFILLLLCNTIINRFVAVYRVSIPIKHLSSELDGITLLQISDLKGAEFGTCQSGIVARIKGEHIDAVVLTGDMISPQGNAKPLYNLLDALTEALPGVPIWFIAGDSDPEPVSMQYASEGSCYASWILGASRHGGRLLRSPVRILENEASVWLIPGADVSLDLRLEEERFRQIYAVAQNSGDEIQSELARFHLARLSEFRDAQRAVHSEDLCIALFHAVDPDTDKQPNGLAGVETYGMDTILAGHWLGGLLRIPCVGPLFIPSVHLKNGGLLPGAGYSGLSHIGELPLYTSPGLGPGDTKYPPFFFRFANPPSITLIRFLASGI